ncbi:MAG: bacteriophage abortive infection AbiH family protein [Acidaminococcaceae bacterium]
MRKNIEQNDLSYFQCINCGQEFAITKEEELFYSNKMWPMPKRCKKCRDIRREKLTEEEKEHGERRRVQQLNEVMATSPFIIIKGKDEIILEPMKTLYIIGNGFDIMHGVPSGYYKFRDSLGKHSDLREALETYIKKRDLWADFEEGLAAIDAEAMIAGLDEWMDRYNAYDPDAQVADFNLAVEAAIGPTQVIMDELPKRFRKWINTLAPNMGNKPLEKLINKRERYINFNYTEFLETIYDVPERNVVYLHGCRRNKREELILGHSQGAESDWSIPDIVEGSHIRMEQKLYDAQEIATNYLGEYDIATEKKTDEIINKNTLFFESLGNIKDIVVIGHSLSKVDYPYFRKIIQCNNEFKDLTWYISCHSANDIENVQLFANVMGIHVKQIKFFII